MKKLFTLLLALVATCVLWAHDFKVNGIYYNKLKDKTNEVEVTYRGSSSYDYDNEYTGSVIIPSTVTYNGTTYSVTSIGDGAFYWCDGLTSVTIPNSVTSIGDRAFEDCWSLTSVTIGNSVTSIGDWAFEYCESLTSITIPNSVTSIGEYAFYGCSNLTSINIPNSVTSIGEYAFYSCSGLTSITIPNSVTNIGDRAFGGCSGLMSIIVEDANSTYDSRENCNAIIETATNTLIAGCKNTTIPNSVTSIGYGAFSGCSSLTSITIPNSVTSIGGSAFEYCESLTSITIPNSVTSIGNEAFKSCESLTSVTIPNSVTSIGDGAFEGCSSLTSITIPNSVTSIGSYAFYDCSGLKSATLGNSVTSIGDDAFWNCSSLTSVIWNAENYADFSSYSSSPFYNLCSQITSFTFGEDVKHIPAYMCFEMSNLTSVTISESVTSIGEEAFAWCSSLPVKNNLRYADTYLVEAVNKNLSTYSIQGRTKWIGDGAFANCSSLTSITIPNSVTSIGYGAFYECSGLTSVTIPNSVTSIGRYAFSWCYRLTSVTIGNSVTYIGEEAFYNCSRLTSITIPNSVTSIGEYAFYSCSGLTSIVVEEGNTVYDSRDNCNAIIKTATNTLIIGCQNTTIPNSVTSIGDYAFWNCSSLTSVTIPNSVTSIGSRAFYACYRLTSVTSLAEVPPTLGTDAFYNVPKNIPVYVPCSSVSAYQSAEGWKAFTNIQGPLAEHSIAVGVNDSIMGTAMVDYNTYCEGNQISATANQGYHFVQWSDGNTDNPRTLVLTQETTLTAEFAPNQYSITTTSSHAERGTTQGDTTVNYLEYATISATANYGYHFTQWNDGNTDNPRTVQVIGDTTYIAQFDKNIYTITTYWDDQMGSVSAPNNAEYLDEITISATANYGYHFVQWSDGNTDNPRTLVLTQDTTFTAEFAPNQYNITTTSFHAERGTTQGDTTVNYLEYATISATANYGYHFTQWNDGNTDNPRVVKVTGDKTYTAYFDKNIYTITTTCDNQMGSVDAPNNAEYLDEITISATANYGYHFVQWSDGNTDNPRALVLTQDTAFTAEFAVSYSGQCGDDLYWAYDEDSKKISITGSGDMYNYTKPTQPWYLFQEQITEVTTSNTTTSIGTSAFEGCIRLGKVSLGYGMGNVAANAFAECKRLYDIYVFASYPPFAEESSFANYNVYLYVPCENQRDYILDVVWGNFKYIECIGAESDDTGGDDVTVTPGTNDVTITWPTEDEAETYSIVITKDGEVFCTLTFNNNGQLVSIAFAPGREGNHPAQYAEATANGYRFTVTGLDESTKYGYNLEVKDSNNQTIQSYEGEFTTMSDVTTDMDNVTSITNVQKILRNGQLLIIRDGKTYNAQGAAL